MSTVSKKFFEARLSRTPENALLESTTNTMFIIDLYLEEQYRSLSEIFLNWLIQHIKLNLSELCQLQFDLMLLHQ